MHPRQGQSREPGDGGDHRHIVGGPGSSVSKGKIPSGSPPLTPPPGQMKRGFLHWSPNFRPPWCRSLSVKLTVIYDQYSSGLELRRVAAQAAGGAGAGWVSRAPWGVPGGRGTSVHRLGAGRHGTPRSESAGLRVD